jgi:2'-5' RNA ligase
MSETIRAFIALELEKQIQEKLAEYEVVLKKSGADVKWVKPENIHLTLKFLGYISAEQIAEIKKILVGLKSKPQFPFSLDELGAFPSLGSPRVIWVGIEQGKKESAEIAAQLEAEIEKIGIPRENRPFKAHLTLGRMRSPKGKEFLKSKIEELNKNFSPLNMSAQKITLFQSTLTPTGSIYTPLFEIQLA